LEPREIVVLAQHGKEGKETVLCVRVMMSQFDKLRVSANHKRDKLLTLQRGELGVARHSEKKPCRGKTSDDRHAARSHSLHNISTTLRANVIGLVWPC
jgi:hypothetical protein